MTIWISLEKKNPKIIHVKLIQFVNDFFSFFSLFNSFGTYARIPYIHSSHLGYGRDCVYEESVTSAQKTSSDQSY